VLLARVSEIAKASVSTCPFFQIYSYGTNCVLSSTFIRLIYQQKKEYFNKYIIYVLVMNSRCI
jgi:hypothetical protein